jgi:hypothetical protein
MRQVDLENLLLDPDGRAELDEIAKELAKSGVEEETRIGGRPFIWACEPKGKGPTLDEARDNDDDHADWPALHIKVATSPRELEGKDRKTGLSVITEQCRKDPSRRNQLYLEDAINRVAKSDYREAEEEELIQKAVEELASPSPAISGGEEEKTKDSIFTRLYTRDDYEGRSYFINHGPGFVYRRIWKSRLRRALCLNCIDSLYVDATDGEVAGEVILFQDDSTSEGGHFEGRYARFTTTPGAPTTRNWVRYVGGHIDNKTSAVLVVRRYANEDTYAVGATLQSVGGLTAIRDRVNDLDPDRVEMRGDVVVTWDVWPDGSMSDRNPRPNDSRRFIWVRIPLNVNASLHPNRRWINYHAEIRYWIYPWVDAAGELQAYVAYSGIWVENGIRRKRVRETIEDYLPDTEVEVNDMLDSALAVLNLTGPFRRQYFLPGTAAATGNSTDDVTLVLVRR